MVGIGQLIREQEPTIVVVPDAVRLDSADCISVQQAAMLHCGTKMKNRVSILDIPDGYKVVEECIPQFRNALGVNNLDYAAAYYPWVNTTIVGDSDLSFENLDEASQKTLHEELAPDVKEELAVAFKNNRPAYTRGKTAFIKAIMERALAEIIDPSLRKLVAEAEQQQFSDPDPDDDTSL